MDLIHELKDAAGNYAEIVRRSGAPGATGDALVRQADGTYQDEGLEGVAIRQATDLVMLWSAGPTRWLELVGITTGSLALQYSTDASTWDFVDGVSGPFVSLQTVEMQSGAQVTPETGFIDATADVLLRVVTVDADDTVATVGEFPRLRKYPVGVQTVRIGAYVKRAGAFATDPQIINVWIEFNASATALAPPPDPDLPPDPSPIETTDLINLFDADEGVTDDGSGNIATWGNQATGSDLTGVTQTTGPVLYDDAGVNCVRFPGYFQFPSGAYTGRTEGHLFMLIRTFTLDHAGSNSGWCNFGGNGIARYGWGSNLELDYCTDALKLANRGSFDITQWHVLDIEADGSTYIVRLNGTVILSTTNGAAVWATVVQLGTGDVTNGVNGDWLLRIMAEYATPQSSDVAANVRNWLAFRGGFTL